MKLIGKRGKIYRQLLKEGKSEPYAKRLSKGLAEGKSVKEARGRHPAERYHKKGTAYKPAQKGRLEKKKEEWAAYAYQDTLGFSDDDSCPLSPFSMSSYDHTKKGIKGYDWQDLFDIHQHLERQVVFAFPDWLNESRMAKKGEGYVDSQEDARYAHRQFEWKMFDEDGELRYWLTYSQGEFQKRQMWEQFDFFECKMELRRIGVWK